MPKSHEGFVTTAAGECFAVPTREEMVRGIDRAHFVCDPFVITGCSPFQSELIQFIHRLSMDGLLYNTEMISSPEGLELRFKIPHKYTQDVFEALKKTMREFTLTIKEDPVEQYAINIPDPKKIQEPEK